MVAQRKPPKSPQQKKAESYKHDRRNTYGESPHGARKNIPRARARGHREERRAARQSLLPVRGMVDASTSDIAQSRATGRVIPLWKKAPDTPLGEVIQAKSRRRRQRSGI